MTGTELIDRFIELLREDGKHLSQDITGHHAVEILKKLLLENP